MREYKPEDHQTIEGWFKKWGMGCPKPQDLPRLGLIDECAAGFLLQTDSSVAILEFFVGNPDSSNAERSRSLDSIVMALTERALEKGYRFIKLSTAIEAAASRALKLGFNEIGFFRTFFRGISNG